MAAQPIALVTGITGQDGSYLAEFLLAQGYQVVGFGRRSSILSAAHLGRLRNRIRFAFGDLTDAVSIAAAIQDCHPSEIYNLAAQSKPGASWELSVETGEVTGLGAHRLFEAVRRFKPDCRIYQASSSEMYGNVLASPQDETTPYNPINPYAVAKVYAHNLAGIYRRAYGLFVACGILFNHESSRRGMQFLSQKITYGAACAAAGITNSAERNEEGEPIVSNGKLALGNLDAARDWGYSGDYVEAMWKMLQQREPDDYVIGTGILRTVRDLCQEAYACVGLDWKKYVITDPRFVRPADTGPTLANPAKALKHLAWAPTTSFESMIAKMVASHQERLAAPG